MLFFYFRQIRIHLWKPWTVCIFPWRWWKYLPSGMYCYVLYKLFGPKIVSCLISVLKGIIGHNILPAGSYLWFYRWKVYTTYICACGLFFSNNQHSPTGALAPAKPRPFCTPQPRPNVSNNWGVFAGVYLFLLEKEPRRNSGKTRP